MRLNKYIRSSGFCSRREADEYIKAGRVRVNGELPSIGYRVKKGDKVTIDGKNIRLDRKLVYILLNKPVGITCTTERDVEGNIIDFMKYNKRIFPIGRLDKDSEGLILLTNDGDIVNKVLREEYGNEKEYMVRVDKNIDDDFIENMENGVSIFNPVKNRHEKTKKCTVEKLSKNEFRIILTQGLNRQIRRMCANLGYEVVALKRVRIKNIHLGSTPIGYWRYLTDEEVEDLKRV